MENKINYKDVPACFTHCIQADCQMANHCLRQLAMQALPDSERAVRILNPQLTKAAEKCEFYRSDEPQVYGKGFTNMQKKMLPGQYDTFRYRLQGKFGRNPYFERRKGERLCSPREIKEVEAALKAIGHEELKFDAYIEKLNWID
jgi:hypothetical protein